MSGAHEQDILRDMLRDVGFVRAEIRVKEESREYIKHWMPGSGAEDYVVAAEVVGGGGDGQHAAGLMRA